MDKYGLCLICIILLVDVVTPSVTESRLVSAGCSGGELTKVLGEVTVKSFQNSVGKVKSSLRKYKRSLGKEKRYKNPKLKVTDLEGVLVTSSVIGGFNFFSKNIQWIITATNNLVNLTKLKKRERKKISKWLTKTSVDWCYMVSKFGRLHNVTLNKSANIVPDSSMSNVSVVMAKEIKTVELLNRFMSCIFKAVKRWGEEATELSSDALRSIDKCNNKIQKKRKKGKKNRKGKKRTRKAKKDKKRKNRRGKKNKKNRKKNTKSKV